ncbi:hypothetical protein ACH4S8_41735 [Streptomyces sp. NPDC021080]|uniref:hypothetical protein n=1 Tax=Streptomyces sp. NPDC021080 TaxID=3365110 RepID=UPI0037B5EC18
MTETSPATDEPRLGQDQAAPTSVTAVVGLLVLFELMSASRRGSRRFCPRWANTTGSATPR